jgi:NADH dehydrogenase
MNTQRIQKHNQKPTILILGGYGFVGRYTARSLQEKGANVIIGTRGGRRADHPHERRIRLHHATQTADWVEVLKGVDAVINCVGILRERKGETFMAVHHDGVMALANTCAAQGIPLVHMSALGITQAKNEYTFSKLLGEQAIITSGCHAYIVRSSVVDAADGYGAGWFHRVAQWPVWPLPNGANKYMSPTRASDLGLALAVLALQLLNNPDYNKPDHSKPAKIIETGCGEWFTLESYLMRLRQKHRALPMVIRIPQTIARLFALLCDRLHLTPYSIGHHDLLEHNNVPGINHLPQIIQRAPEPIGEAITEAIDIRRPRSDVL